MLNNEGIEWKIPAYPPDSGGLWESKMKSCKYTLKRVLGNTPLKYEDFSIMLEQIDAILNSRPLITMYSCPDAFEVLTLSHFLIGQRLTAVLDPNLERIPINRLTIVFPENTNILTLDN